MPNHWFISNYGNLVTVMYCKVDKTYNDMAYVPSTSRKILLLEEPPH